MNLKDAHALTVADVKALHATERMKHERDKREHGDLSLDEAMIRATRTAVHAALHLQMPTPPAEKDEDPDDTHMKQKSHGKALWKEVDRLVAEAKLGEKS